MNKYYTPEQLELAEALHKNYRAAEKAMNRTKKIWRKDKQVKNKNLILHDHGWKSCGKKQYFIARAMTLKCFNT